MLEKSSQRHTFREKGWLKLENVLKTIQKVTNSASKHEEKVHTKVH